MLRVYSSPPFPNLNNSLRDEIERRTNSTPDALFVHSAPAYSPTMAKNLEICMADILAQLIDEAQQVPEPVLELLLANFNPQAIKANPAAHNLAVQVCQAAEHRLQKYVAHYFTDVITSSMDEDQDKNERDANLTRTYTLIMEINRTVPALLLNVVPQMEGELTSEDQSLRLMVTRVLGQMFGERRFPVGASSSSSKAFSEGGFARTYPSVWKAWIRRSNDRTYHIRIVWLECVQSLLRYHPSLVAEVIPVLTQKLLDPDERVRTIAARVLGSMDYETALHRTPKSLLEALAERCMDKKRTVRENAMNALGRLFHLAYPEIESHDKAAIEKFAWIPSAVLSVLRTSDVTEQDVADVVERWILPYPSYGTMGQSAQTRLQSSQSSSQGSSSQQSQSQGQSLTAGVAFTGATDETAWVGRLLLVLKYGDSFTKSVIFKLSNLVEPLSIWSRFIQACEAYKGGLMDQDETRIKQELKTLLKAVAKVLGEQPGADRVASDLLEFARFNDVRCYRLLHISMDPKQDMKSLLKARVELRRRLEGGTSKSVVQTMMHFWRGTSFPLVNRTTIGQLLRGINQGRPGSSAASQASADSFLPLGTSRVSLAGYEVFLENATAILAQATKSHPHMLVPFVPELIRIVRESEATGDDNPYATTVALRALAAISRVDPPATKLVREGKSIAALKHLALKGQVDEAKFAAEALAVMSERNALSRQGDGVQQQKIMPQGAPLSKSELVSAQQAVEDVLETIADELGDVREAELASHLAALLAIVKYAPDVFEERAQSIIKDVLSAIKRPWIEVKTENGAVVPADAQTWARKEEDGEEEEEEWTEPEDLDDNTRSRMLGLRVITKRAEVYAHTEHAEMTVKPIMRFLFHCLGATDIDSATAISNAGMGDRPQSSGKAKSALPPMPGLARSWLRLTAASCLLKLARHKAYAPLVTSQMLPLAFVVQDRSFGVRNLFLRKLCTYLSCTKLTPPFYAVPFLVALDPEEENQHMVRYFLRKVIWGVSTAQRFKTVEYTFARFLHLLAHHPDFHRDAPDEVLPFSLYIDFYLTSVANEENINLFWYIGSRLKTLRTADSVGSSENMYALCELAQLRIKRKALSNGWTIEPWPSKIAMPSDIFRPLPNKEVQKEIYARQFLPEQVVQRLNQDLDQVSHRKRPPAERAIEARPSKRSKARGRKARARSHATSTDEEDEEDEVESRDSDHGGAEEDDEEEDNEEEEQQEEQVTPRPATARTRPKPRAAVPKARGETRHIEEEMEEMEERSSDVDVQMGETD